MARFRLRMVAVAAGVIASSSVLNAQEVLETPAARIEFIGLKRWTIPMLRDSLARYAPENALTGHACAVALRQALRFADAAVSNDVIADAQGRRRTVITVVEPQDSTLVRYRPLAPDSLPTITRYAAAVAAFRAHPGDFQRAVQDSGFLLARRAPSAAPSDAWRVALEPIRTMLVAEATPAGQARAYRTLARDRNPYNRLIAVLVVSTDATADSAWWTLVNELRYPFGFVAGTADQVLRTLASHAARPVDWAPALDPLAALLGGTNLFAHSTVMRVLARTHVAPRLAPALLRSGAPLLLGTLRSTQGDHEAARLLLTQLSVRDYGDDVVAWERWVRTAAPAGP